MDNELFTFEGRRKYLTATERIDFLAKARQHERAEVRTFCALLAFTGCRISEALALTPERIDLTAKTVTFQTLKQRDKVRYRSVPVPDELLNMLDDVHGIRRQQKRKAANPNRLWLWQRTQAYKHVKSLMANAGITGAHAVPKGLRHGFGILAMSKTRNPRLVQRWMGHSKIENTMIYMDALGDEEREAAALMW